ncbi:hypothetical protein BDP67DRAFT_623762 [Colletotrichum lupini]|nr:hypothetical protein BDP67DRAFT_623762 [Colletotrichum lupini]
MNTKAVAAKTNKHPSLALTAAKMSSNRAHSPSQYTAIPQPRQAQFSNVFTYNQPNGSDGLNTWLTAPASAAPFHNIAAYRLSASASAGGANMRGPAPAPSSNGATWGSGHGRQN